MLPHNNTSSFCLKIPTNRFPQQKLLPAEAFSYSALTSDTPNEPAHFLHNFVVWICKNIILPMSCYVRAALNVYFVVEKVEFDFFASRTLSRRAWGNENANVAALNVNAGNNNQFSRPLKLSVSGESFFPFILFSLPIFFIVIAFDRKGKSVFLCVLHTDTHAPRRRIMGRKLLSTADDLSKLLG